MKTDNLILTASELVSGGGEINKILKDEYGITSSASNSEYNEVKLEQYRKSVTEFNKVFGFLKNKDIVDEYVKCILKVSKMSATKRKLLLSYVIIRRENDKKFNELMIEIDKLIEKSMEENKNEMANNC